MESTTSLREHVSVSRFWLVILRVTLGWIFLYAGLSKLFGSEAWTAAGYLSHLDGPFAPLFSWMAGSVVVDWLNMLGLTLIGLAFIVGLLTRFAAFWGALLMLFYYLAGYPHENSFLIDDHIIYMIVCILFLFGGSAKCWSLDSKFMKGSEKDSESSWKMKLMG